MKGATEQHRFHDDDATCFPGCPAWDSKPLLTQAQRDKLAASAKRSTDELDRITRAAERGLRHGQRQTRTER